MHRTIAVVMLSGVLGMSVAGWGSIVAAGEPPTAAELLGKLTTEEVEPGVFRVLGDGVHDLASMAPYSVQAGLEGSVWVVGGGGFIRLGDEPTHTWPDEDWEPWRTILAVGADGRVWGGGTRKNGGSVLLTSFDGSTWEVHRVADHPHGSFIGPLEAGGALWLASTDDWTAAGSWTLERYDGSRWQEVASLPVEPAFLGVTDAGDVFTIGWPSKEDPSWSLQRYRGSAWHQVEIEPEIPTGGWTLGADGTLWAHTPSGPLQQVLGRLEGDAWTTWGEQAVGEFDANLPVGYVAAPDGALWIAEKVRTFGQFEPPVTCQGVARFDGIRLERFLENLCIRFIDVGPDGSAWLLADEPDGTSAPPDPIHLYAITREAK